MIRTYSELCKLISFEERYEYLRLCGKVGDETLVEIGILIKYSISLKNGNHLGEK